MPRQSMIPITVVIALLAACGAPDLGERNSAVKLKVVRDVEVSAAALAGDPLYTHAYALGIIGGHASVTAAWFDLIEGFVDGSSPQDDLALMLTIPGRTDTPLVTFGATRAPVRLTFAPSPVGTAGSGAASALLVDPNYLSPGVHVQLGQLLAGAGVLHLEWTEIAHN